MNKLTSYLLILGGSLLAGCSASDEPEAPQPDASQPRQCVVDFQAEKPAFDDADSRSAAAWANGDKVYVTFSYSAYGYATYSAGEWTLTYYGSIPQGVTSCTAAYFENDAVEAGSTLQLAPTSAIYHTADGRCVASGSSVTLTATLTPRTARVRFDGAPGETLKLCGLKYASAYDFTSGKFTEIPRAFDVKVSNSGSTPYVYVSAADDSHRVMGVITSSSAFSRGIPDNLLRPGCSGRMTVPAVNAHSGWTNSLRLKAEGVEFTMIPVSREGKFYLLGETEVTRELRSQVTGGSYTVKTPEYGVTDWPAFLERLSLLTGLDFRFPTYDEWLFAARGGERSTGCTYSGSNLLDEVGWYYSNSRLALKNVRELRPNELGFYDMSGNIAELTIFSPTVYRACGGYYMSDAESCAVNSYEETTATGATRYGLRLAI